MRNERGAALILLLLAALFFIFLGGALLHIALSDLRIGGHLLATEQAYYAAEAGIELTAAVLGPLCRDLGEEGWSYEHRGEPCFTVYAKKEEGQVLRITAVGSSSTLTRQLEVLASLRPMGRQALISRTLEIREVKVDGHVTADTVNFAGGWSYINGDLRALQLEVIPGGGYTCTGQLCNTGMPYSARVDFIELAEEAFLSGWSQIPAGNGYCLVEKLESCPVLAEGNTKIKPLEPLAGLIVVLGDVILESWTDGSRLAIIADGDVMLCGDGSEWAGSLFVAGSGMITNYGDKPLAFSGCLAASALVLKDMTVKYCDEAVLDNISHLPLALLQLQPTFDLEWLESRPRR